MKYLYLIFSILIVCNFNCSRNPLDSPPIENPYYGDINLDKVISILDVEIIFDFRLKRCDLTIDQKKRADVSGNGTITSYDAGLILQYIDKKINIFPVENKN